jgi:hypothetical protein
VAIDEQHVALPKLYGAPAYARPAPIVVEETPRPFDPDDLPIEAVQTPEEKEIASTLSARAYAPGGMKAGEAIHRTPRGNKPSLRPKPLSLKALAGRILGSGES